jgi:heme exporter protein B
MIREIKYLVKKEILLEWRQKYAIGGMMLYLGSSIFIGHIVFNIQGGALNSDTWNALLWIIMLFAAVNSIAKSFIQESPGRLFYYYTITAPTSLITSKIIYNSLLMFVLMTFGVTIYSVLLGNPIQNLLLYTLVLLIGSVALAATFTMISGIASKASNSSTLMAILGFPIIIPVLLLLIKVSQKAIEGADLGAVTSELTTLLAIIVIAITTSILLFPYLWRSE